MEALANHLHAFIISFERCRPTDSKVKRRNFFIFVTKNDFQISFEWTQDLIPRKKVALNYF
jgi:hypothetical protein